MQGALAKIPQIEGLVTNPAKKGATASFKAPKGFDYKSKLDACVAAGVSHLKDWSVAE